MLWWSLLLSGCRNDKGTSCICETCCCLLAWNTNQSCGSSEGIREDNETNICQHRVRVFLWNSLVSKDAKWELEQCSIITVWLLGVPVVQSCCKNSPVLFRRTWLVHVGCFPNLYISSNGSKALKPSDLLCRLWVWPEPHFSGICASKSPVLTQFVIQTWAVLFFKKRKMVLCTFSYLGTVLFEHAGTPVHWYSTLSRDSLEKNTLRVSCHWGHML